MGRSRQSEAVQFPSSPAFTVKNSLSLPLFDKDNNLPDDLAKAFTEYVKANKATLETKTIYILCNSGSKGATKATALLAQAGFGKLSNPQNVKKQVNNDASN